MCIMVPLELLKGFKNDVSKNCVMSPPPPIPRNKLAKDVGRSNPSGKLSNFIFVIMNVEVSYHEVDKGKKNLQNETTLHCNRASLLIKDTVRVKPLASRPIESSTTVRRGRGVISGDTTELN